MKDIQIGGARNRRFEQMKVGTWKSYINVDHIAKERWSPFLVDADWHAFCQALFKGIEGEDCGELYDFGREHLRDPIVVLDKALKCVWRICSRSVGPSALWRECLAMAGVGFLQSFWKSLSGRAFGPTWTRWIVCVYAQHPWHGMWQGSTGRTASSFSS